MLFFWRPDEKGYSGHIDGVQYDVFKRKSKLPFVKERYAVRAWMKEHDFEVFEGGELREIYENLEKVQDPRSSSLAPRHKWDWF